MISPSPRASFASSFTRSESASSTARCQRTETNGYLEINDLRFGLGRRELTLFETAKFQFASNCLPIVYSRDAVLKRGAESGRLAIVASNFLSINHGPEVDMGSKGRLKTGQDLELDLKFGIRGTLDIIL
jgi:hypothetical protein